MIESRSGKIYNVYFIGHAEAARAQLARLFELSATYPLFFVEDALELLTHPDKHPDVVILDVVEPDALPEIVQNFSHRLPDVPVIALLDKDADVEIAPLEALGVFGWMNKPVEATELRIALRAAEFLQDLRVQIRQLQASLAGEVRLDQVAARSAVMHNVMMLVRKACSNEITVLLEGEEGVGKEDIARAIHFNGRRADGPFLMLNCAAIPQHLLELELFGAEPEAYGEGSESKPAIFEQAQGGTLFIDEIGLMDPILQARLFRTMQTRLYRRIGGEEDLSVDLRIITATSRDLRAMCAAGTFREDLYFRLASFAIMLPALRDRPADIPMLTEAILRRYAEKQGRPGLGISVETVQLLRKYRWPGNIPELDAAIERAVVLAEGVEIRPDDLPKHILVATGRKPAINTPGTEPGKTQTVPTMEQLKARGVRIALEASGGNIKEAARLLDIGRTTIYQLMEKYNIHD